MAAKKKTGLQQACADGFDRALAPDPPWFRQADRKRKMVALTLSDEARDRLGRLARLHNVTASEMVDALIMGAPTLED